MLFYHISLWFIFYYVSLLLAMDLEKNMYDNLPFARFGARWKQATKNRQRDDGGCGVFFKVGHEPIVKWGEINPLIGVI